MSEHHIAHQAAHAANRFAKLHETDLLHGRDLAPVYELIGELAGEVATLRSRVDELERRPPQIVTVAPKPSLMRRIFAHA